MGCGGLCGVKPNVAHKPCDDCSAAAAWGSFFNPWGPQRVYPPVGANPYDEATGLSGGNLSLDKNSYQPATSTTTSTGGGIPAGAWNAIDTGLVALQQFGTTLSNNDVERARIRAQADAAAAGASDATIAALGGRAPQYTTSNLNAPGDSVRYGTGGGGSSSSSALPWLVAAGLAAAVLMGGKRGLRL